MEKEITNKNNGLVEILDLALVPTSFIRLLGNKYSEPKASMDFAPLLAFYTMIGESLRLAAYYEIARSIIN